jgi:hypothetical protein
MQPPGLGPATPELNLNRLVSSHLYFSSRRPQASQAIVLSIQPVNWVQGLLCEARYICDMTGPRSFPRHMHSSSQSKRVLKLKDGFSSLLQE